MLGVGDPDLRARMTGFQASLRVLAAEKGAVVREAAQGRRPVGFG